MEQDFIKFMEKVSYSSSTPDIKEVVDLYISLGGESSCNTSLPSYTDQLTVSLEDFDEFEKTLPTPKDELFNIPNGASLGIESIDLEETEIMINEMAENGSLSPPSGAVNIGIDLEETNIMINEMAENGSLSPPSGAEFPVNMDSYEGLENYQSQVVYVKYGDLQSYGPGSSEINVVLNGLFGPVTGDSIALRGCWMNLRKRKKGAEKADVSRTRVKTRSYRDIGERAN